MGGCQNYGPFLGTLNIRCRIIIGTQKGTIILTTTHVVFRSLAAVVVTYKVVGPLEFREVEEWRTKWEVKSKMMRELVFKL